MRLLIFKFQSILLLCLLSQFLAASNVNIADKIQQKFDDNLFKLKPVIQSHYAVRLYRITGNKDYLFPIIAFQFIESIQLQQLIQHETGSSQINSQKIIHTPLHYPAVSKTKKRKAFLAQFPSISNYLKILLILDHAQQLNTLDSSPLYPQTKTAIALIQQNLKSLSSFLLDPVVIKTSPAQVANFIYLLKRLELIDLRKKYIHQFKRLYADNKDNPLDNQGFEDKIYGMTHIIFAASDYYQKRISDEQFSWIFRYFDQHMNKILTDTKPDVIAEVGLTYCLVNNSKYSSPLEKIKQHLKNSFDPAQHIIPNKSGNPDLNLAEHRNVLTIMLFKCPSLLYPGPNLANTTEFYSIFKLNEPL